MNRVYGPEGYADDPHTLVEESETGQLQNPDGPGTFIPERHYDLVEQAQPSVGRIIVATAVFGQTRGDTFPRPYDD